MCSSLQHTWLFQSPFPQAGQTLADESPEPEPYIKSFHTVELAGSKAVWLFLICLSHFSPSSTRDWDYQPGQWSDPIFSFVSIIVYFIYLFILASENMNSKMCDFVSDATASVPSHHSRALLSHLEQSLTGSTLCVIAYQCFTICKGTV